MAGGLSSYAPGAQDPRSRALANNRMSDQDSAGLDQMLSNIDSGAAMPGTMGESRAVMPQPAAQGQAPWLQWLMQYLQGQQTQPQGQPR